MRGLISENVLEGTCGVGCTYKGLTCASDLRENHDYYFPPTIYEIWHTKGRRLLLPDLPLSLDSQSRSRSPI